MGLNESNFWEDLGSKYPISMIYFFGQRAIILSDPDLINYIFKHNSKLFTHVNDRMAQPKSRQLPQEEVSLIAKMYHEWPARRQLVVKALQRVLNHKYIDNIVSNIFKTTLYKQILLNTNNFTNSWKTTNDDLRYFQFYLLFYSIFGNQTTDSKQSKNCNCVGNMGSTGSDKRVQKGAISNISEETLKEYGAIMIDLVDKMIKTGTKSTALSLMGLDFIYSKETDPVKKFLNEMRHVLLDWINKHTKFGPNITDDIVVTDDEKYGKIIANMKRLLEIEEKEKEKEKDGDHMHRARGGDDPITFILDTLLDAMIDRKKYSTSGNKQLGIMNMKSVLSEISVLFGAGMETTSNSMEFIIVQLAKRITIQNQIYNELINYLKKKDVSVVNNDENYGCKTVDTSKIDFTQLNLLRAFLWECLRVHSVVSRGVPHVCNKTIDIQFKNKKYVIPKGSIIMFNALYINTNGKFWDRDGDKSRKNDDDIFDLGHWLNKESGKFEMNNNFVGFGTGRRDCVGKHLAINILRRLMVLFLINFKVYGPNGPSAGSVDVDQNIDPKFKAGFTRILDPAIPIMLQPRNNYN